MFQFPTFPPYHSGFMITVTEVLSVGFPHSDIHGSLDICSSPWLFAAYHVLRRLLVPRHPPYALFSLIFEVALVSFLKQSLAPGSEIDSLAFFSERSVECLVSLPVLTSRSIRLNSLDRFRDRVELFLSMCNFQGPSGSLENPTV